MNNKKTLIIACIIIPIIFAVVIFFSVLQQKVKDNPPGTIGNTAGNLNNGGTFCEANGKVYFSNAYDQDTLYVMNSDESNIKKLSNAQPNYINVGGNYLYYYQVNSSAAEGLGFVRRVSGIYRSNLKGSNAACLKRDLSGIVTLVDNSLFYQDYNNQKGMTLYRINTNKSDDKEIAPYIINPASVQDGFLYFNGMQENHYLFRLNTADNSISTVWEEDVWNPIVQGDSVYYMDIMNDYRLCRYSLSNDTIEVLTNDRVDTFNVSNDYIYYQKNSETEPALKRIHMDGSGEEFVASGNFERINITSNYVYFNTFDSPTPMYRTSTNGPVNVTIFEAAKEAAYANMD